MAFVQFDASQPLRSGANGLGVFVASPRRSAGSPRRSALLAIAVTLMATLLGATPSLAAIVTTNESELDSIFSQSSFGATPVDIRFLPTITIVDPNLLDIDNQTDFYNLVNQFNSSPVHNAYFVDSIGWCGNPLPNIAGCAAVGGNDFVIDSDFAAGSNGAELIAHELAHNLGLTHDSAPTNGNLLGPTINENTTLTAGQVETILSGSRIQTDVLGNRFVQIQPILVAAIAAISVPEPSTALLVASLLGLFACNTRRWRV